MAEEYTVRVHFISGDEGIVSAVNFHNVGEEGPRRHCATRVGTTTNLERMPVLSPTARLRADTTVSTESEKRGTISPSYCARLRPDARNYPAGITRPGGAPDCCFSGFITNSNIHQRIESPFLWIHTFTLKMVQAWPTWSARLFSTV